jgi:hypothetical protein
MSDKNAFGERGKALEDEHFRKREAELIAKMRERAERREMAAATGIDDDAILGELQALGFNTETITLLPLIPLVQVAWADGSVAAGERARVLEIAEAHGIADGSAAHGRLVAMLDRRPAEDVFEDAFRVVRMLKSAGGEAWVTPENFVDYCRQVAEAAGGFLGFGKVSDQERELIERIAAELESAHAAGAREVIDHE